MTYRNPDPITGKQTVAASQGATDALGANDCVGILVARQEDLQPNAGFANMVRSTSANGVEPLRIMFNQTTGALNFRLRDNSTPVKTLAFSLPAISFEAGDVLLAAFSWDDSANTNTAFGRVRGDAGVTNSGTNASFGSVQTPTEVSLFGNGTGADESFVGDLAFGMAQGTLTQEQFDAIYAEFLLEPVARTKDAAMDILGRWDFDLGFTHTVDDGSGA